MATLNGYRQADCQVGKHACRETPYVHCFRISCQQLQDFWLQVRIVYANLATSKQKNVLQLTNPCVQAHADLRLTATL